MKETDKIFLQLITNNNDKNIRFYKKVVDKCPKFFTLNDEYSKDDVKTEMTEFMDCHQYTQSYQESDYAD